MGVRWFALLPFVAVSASAQITSTGTIIDDDGASVWVCEDTHNAASAALANVNTAISSADDGDCVVVPAGSATWASALSMPTNRGIQLIGDGIGSTVITCSGECLLVPNNQTHRVSGFSFTTSSSTFFTQRVNSPAVGKVQRYDHNAFTNTGGSWGSIDIYGEPPSSCDDAGQLHSTVLFDSNVLTDVRILMVGTACSFGDGDAQHRLWSQDPHPSAVGAWPEILYVEDNTFVGDGDIINCMDANYGGRYVFRFNTITAGTGDNRCYLEMHGEQGDNRGVQWTEVYNNTVEDEGNDNFFGLYFKRSGTGVFFDNTVPATSQEAYIDDQRSWRTDMDECDGDSLIDGNTPGEGGWPCRDQIGRKMDTEFTGDETADQDQLDPLYIWNNIQGASTSYDTPEINMSGDGLVDEHLQQNRDWYSLTGSFDGTAGIGRGTLASRPSTCTANVAYWATDQGEWNSTNGATADGQLYRCTSTDTWTLYYIPLAYPHSLRD